MNTLFFKYAIEVERTRSISQAAENLFMSQPNLSKAIREMEDNLGFSIFERSTKGVMPTSQGKEFLIYARNIVSQLEQMEQIAVPDKNKIQPFKISIPRGSYISSGFTSFVEELDTSEGININIQETNSMQTISNISSGKFNLGIIRYNKIYERYFIDYLSEKNISYEPVWEFEYLALLSAKHALSDAGVLEYSKLKEGIEVVHGDNIIPYLSADNAEKKSKTESIRRKIYVYDRCSQFEILSRIHTSYMWVSPIPEEFLKRYGLKQRRCSVSDHKFKDALIYPRGYKLSELDKKFIDKLFEAKNKVAFQEYS